MKIELLSIGPTEKEYLRKGISLYQKRLQHYNNFSIEEISLPKVKGSTGERESRELQGELLLKRVSSQDLFILLDERGELLSSPQFAKKIENWGVRGVKRVLFAIGGAYGFSDKVYQRADGEISLSKMTFSHQMVRLIFIEQLYRAFTIIKGEPYHHK